MNAPNNDVIIDFILNDEDEEEYEESYSESNSLWEATVEAIEREILQGRRPSNT
jgi:hypothetical protein